MLTIWKAHGCAGTSTHSFPSPPYGVEECKDHTDGAARTGINTTQADGSAHNLQLCKHKEQSQPSKVSSAMTHN